MHAFADDAILAAGFDYWLNLPRPAGCPDRADADPSLMPKAILPYVALLEVLDGGADARYRLAGQEFNENFGVNLKGKKTTDLTEGAYQDYILGHLWTLVEKRQPLYSESAFRWDRGGRLRTRRLMMPLSHGEPGVVAMVFKLQTWPREKMHGRPFCEVIPDCTEVSNCAPRIVRADTG